MAIRNDASLRGKIRAIAKREGLRPQEVLQIQSDQHEYSRKRRMLISSFSKVAC